MRAVVGTVDGVYLVDLEDETIMPLGAGEDPPPRAPVEISLPLLVDAAASGSTVIAVVRKPGSWLVVSRPPNPPKLTLTWPRPSSEVVAARLEEVNRHVPTEVHAPRPAASWPTRIFAH